MPLENPLTYDGFVIGYERAMHDYEEHEKRGETASNSYYLANPFPEGTHAYRGYEDAVYDLTEK